MSGKAVALGKRTLKLSSKDVGTGSAVDVSLC